MLGVIDMFRSGIANAVNGLICHHADTCCLCVGSNYAVHNGLERLVKRLGAERLLFGSGFPYAQPDACIETLLGFNKMLINTVFYHAQRKIR